MCNAHMHDTRTRNTVLVVVVVLTLCFDIYGMRGLDYPTYLYPNKKQIYVCFILMQIVIFLTI